MLIGIVLLVLGFVFLIKGADIMVDGSAALARRFGVSAFFIGMTVVAFGTSAPELVVSVLAGIKGSAGVALGNVIGSNISNTLLILGVSALFAPLAVKRATISKELPFALLAAAAVAVLLNDRLIDGAAESILSRVDGIVLILFFVIFITYTFGISRETGDADTDDGDGLPAPLPLGPAILKIAGGLIGLGVGGKLIVDQAVYLAASWGISEALVGLTIVAVGTSLPELAASAVAARKGNTDIAVGNVVGSNIFNLLWVLGLSAIISPLAFIPGLNADLLFLAVATILLSALVILSRRHAITRREGLFLLTLYFFYIVYLVVRG